MPRWRSCGELLDQHLRVDDDAVADDAALAGVEDPGRDEVELPLVAVAHDRVAGVVAALEAHDRVGPLGEQVGDLALALVAPLGADDHDSRHSRSVGCGARLALAGRPLNGSRARGRAMQLRVGHAARVGSVEGQHLARALEAGDDPLAELLGRARADRGSR